MAGLTANHYTTPPKRPTTRWTRCARNLPLTFVPVVCSDAAGMLDSNVDARFGGNAAEEEEVEEVLEAAAAAWGGENEANRQLREARRRRLARNAKAKSANAQSSMEEEEEELCEALLNVPFEPLTVLYRSTPVRKWERENGYAFRPEVRGRACLGSSPA
eukprot:scaffold7785_cov27-Tisochrysis_lutea.AAC.4